MAKVTAPLMSMSASGQFGKTMVFQKNGYVREYITPANPQTVAQMTVRNRLGDLQRSLKTLGTLLRGELKTGFGARWNSMIIKELTDNGAAKLTTLQTTWTAYTSQQKTDWGTADLATPVALTDGFPLYACAKAIFDIAARLGVTVTLTEPSASNSVTVGAEWVDTA